MVRSRLLLALAFPIRVWFLVFKASPQRSSGETLRVAGTPPATLDSPQNNGVDRTGGLTAASVTESDAGMVAEPPSTPRGDDPWLWIDEISSGQARHYVLSRLRARHADATTLRDYAIEQGLDVDETALRTINALTYVLQSHAAIDSPEGSALSGATMSQMMTSLDSALLKLGRVTYPLTAEDVRSNSLTIRYRTFIAAFAFIGLAGAFTGAVWSTMDGAAERSHFATASSPVFHLFRVNSLFADNSLLAVSLGFLGAVFYSFLNVLGVTGANLVTVQENEYRRYSRLILGVLVGWVFFFIFAQGAYGSFSRGAVKADTATKLMVLLPFLAGYSADLVVRIFDKAISAVELTLGLDGAARQAVPQAATPTSQILPPPASTSGTVDGIVRDLRP